MKYSHIFIWAISIVTVTGAPSYNCIPGKKCWPNQQQWQQLNLTLGGQLHQTIPLGAPCYRNSTYFEEDDCSSVQAVYNSSLDRVSNYGQTFWQNWESCGSSGCSLLSSDPTEELFPTCSLGTLAPYYVDVRDASHISAALQFSKQHNIRTSIKNTGHDFAGRSVGPNTLAIWTHNLSNMSFHRNFTAWRCPAANGHNVGELGAGVVAVDAYRYFSNYGMDITGGYEESVGLAGGFAQGGGVGDFTARYGLMVDNAIEFEVVTADGQVRVINECNDPDLFWAMRGGGGGTFAVLTKLRVQLYPSLPIHTYRLVVNISNSDALRALLTLHAENQIIWSDALITGGTDYYVDKASFGIVHPNHDNGTKLKETTKAFHDTVNDLQGITVIQNNYTTFANYTAYTSFSIADARATEPAGISSLLSSRLMPRHLFVSSSSIASLVDAVVYGIETAYNLISTSGVQVVFETPLSNPDIDRKTSAHPAWRDALWHVINVAEWEKPLDPATLKKVSTGFLDLLEPAKALTPGGGAYMNEASYEELEWQQVFFGDNYARLLKVKNQYDPDHVFDCWKCVGWRGEEK
ncbi:isoamyl alcohol oxidase [Phaeosphaeriaceae sp. SRC1lsM3a]|nr:isoamyl alcohol oxidase [Stagonospora sp. SRC1lsM3a]